MIPEVLGIIQVAGLVQNLFEQFREEIRTFANFPSLFMGLVTPGGERAAYYEGKLRFIDSHGNIVADNWTLRITPTFMGEAVEPFTFMKSPYYKPLGYPGGIYRVGPLARLNLSSAAALRSPIRNGRSSGPSNAARC